jgi:hypothetical protein
MTTKYVKKKWTVIAKFKIHYIKVCDTYIFEFPATVGCKRPLFHIHEVSPQCPVIPMDGLSNEYIDTKGGKGRKKRGRGNYLILYNNSGSRTGLAGDETKRSEARDKGV